MLLLYRYFMLSCISVFTVTLLLISLCRLIVSGKIKEKRINPPKQQTYSCTSLNLKIDVKIKSQPMLTNRASQQGPVLSPLSDSPLPCTDDRRSSKSPRHTSVLLVANPSAGYLKVNGLCQIPGALRICPTAC